MTHKWEISELVQLTESGGTEPSATIQLPTQQPLIYFTVWATAKNSIVDVDVSVQLNGVNINGSSTLSITGTQPAAVVYSAGDIVIPANKESKTPAELTVLVVNNDSALAALTIHAVAFTFAPT